MSGKEPIKVVRDVLINQLGLGDDHVMLAYQKFDIPPDNSLYIALSYLDGSPIASVNSWDPAVEQEIQEVTLRDAIQIDMMSFGSAARLRRPEVIAALGSVYSQQQQQANDMQIAILPTPWLNASSLEETQFLTRFTNTIAATWLSRYVRKPAFYDSFGGKLLVDGQPPVQFDPETSPEETHV